MGDCGASGLGDCGAPGFVGGGTGEEGGDTINTADDCPDVSFLLESDL